MASSRKTLDVDIITLRQVNIRGSNNSIIPSSSVLLSDGRGGTYWSYISTAGNYPSFNQIQVNSNLYTATPTNRTFVFQAGDGIGFTDGGPGSNTAYIYAKAFQTVTVPGLSSIYAYSNDVMNSNLFFSTVGGMNISTDTTTNTLYFRAAINTINIIQNTSTIASSYVGLPSTILPITAARSTLSFIGIGDVFINSDVNLNTLAIGVNGYSQQSYVDLSRNIVGFQSTMLGTASTTYISKHDLSTSLSNISTMDGSNISTISFQNSYANYNSIVGSTLSTFSTQTQIYYSSLLVSTTQQVSSISTSTYFSISTLSSYFFQLNQSTISTFIYRQLVSTNSGFSTILYGTSGQLYSTLSSFQGAISTIELLSTTSSLLQGFAFTTSTTNVATSAYISSMSTSLTTYLKNSILPKISIVSSLTHGGSLGDSKPFTYNTVTGSLEFSTAQFSMKDVVSSIVSSRADVSIEYSPVLLLPMASANQTPLQNFCTVITYNGSTVVPNANFVETIPFSHYLPTSGASAYSSNVYSRYMRIRLDAGWVASNGVHNYTIRHYSPTLAQSIHSLGTACNSTLHIRTPCTNSLFLNIFNVD